ETQKIPATMEQVWEFMSNPANLQQITPSYMGFKITSISGDKGMYPGMIISYKVKPVLNLPITWVTEITHVKHLEFFVDEQRLGPYKMWHHQHKIEPIDGGVLMTDIVTYIPPFGFLGAIANTLFIKKQLVQIFKFRKKAVEQIFGILN
ncbi:MAG: SRPBCC family protein, partial [Chitinophagaceae bacterium]